MYSNEIILYNFFFFYFMQYLNTGTNAARLGILAPQLLVLNNMLAAWTIKFNLYMDPGTHGEITTNDINNLYTIDFRYTEDTKKQIKNTVGLVLSGADRKYTGIKEEAVRRNNIPAPKQKIGVVLSGSSHLSNTFNAFDLDNPTKRGKPDDVAKIGVKMLTRPVPDPSLPPPPKPTLDDLNTMPSSGAMKIVQSFTDLQVGMEGFFAVCFMNEKGEEGVWSEIIPFKVI